MNVREVGPHRLSNRSLEQVEYGELSGGETIDMIYTDPPWTEELMEYYAELQNEQSEREVFGNLTYPEMLDVVCDIAEEHVDGFVCVATQADDAETYAILDKRLYNVEQQTVKYRDDYCGVYIGGTGPAHTFDTMLGLTSGIDTVKTCIRTATEEGDIVCDPMCGKGQVAEAAVSEDRVFVGNDFNESRIDEAEALLESFEQ